MSSEAPSPLAAFQRHSTMVVAPELRFDYWRSLHPSIALDLPQGRHAGDYRACVISASSAGGAVLGWCTNDDTAAHFAQDNGNCVLVSLTLAGEARLRQGPDRRLRVTSQSGLVVLDSCQPLSSLAMRHSMLYLMIPRDQVHAKAPGALTLAGSSPFSLPDNAMTRMLTAHLLGVIKEREAFAGEALECALDTACDMSLVALAQLKGPLSLEWEATQRESLMNAACRYIELHAGEPRLNVDSIAHALGCSRAGLYRAFAAHPESVAETLRRTRLEQARARLKTRHPPSIDQLSYHCGYLNAASFTRAFRRQYGASPQDWHREWCERQLLL
ncbi:AraC family transcriptional regulator [Halomonas sp. YLB-10]|nr:AraC family transcriptional regulator [Halomonas sp. YLB-10]